MLPDSFLSPPLFCLRCCGAHCCRLCFKYSLLPHPSDSLALGSSLYSSFGPGSPSVPAPFCCRSLLTSCPLGSALLAPVYFVFCAKFCFTWNRFCLRDWSLMDALIVFVPFLSLPLCTFSGFSPWALTVLQAEATGRMLQ